ncbi:MAG: hypothetical protein ACFE0I_22440 [Elainellaceae cyanobacterium]
MDAFAPTPPEWTQSAEHAYGFRCPKCNEPPAKAHHVWINRRSPVYTLDHTRKWQEFYQCECGGTWWAWSSDRPPTDLDDASSSESLADENQR